MSFLMHVAAVGMTRALEHFAPGALPASRQLAPLTPAGQAGAPGLVSASTAGLAGAAGQLLAASGGGVRGTWSRTSSYRDDSSGSWIAPSRRCA